MKFGKHIQAYQVPGWSAYYLDYKFLKKIISSLAAKRPASEAAALALGVLPADILSPSALPALQSHSLTSQQRSITDEPGRPPIFSASGQDEDRGPDFQAHKAAFFFKLERELEKINEFYLQREAALKLRLETLLSKRRAAAMRGLPDTVGDTTQDHVEWSAVEEGFRLLERDLSKLQGFVEINATGFRKILKKWDKRSTSSTKELYLTRQVDVQPVFNRQLISELSDTVAACLLDLADLSSGLKFESPASSDIFAQQIMIERNLQSGPFHDFEKNLRKAIASTDEAAIKEIVDHATSLSQQNGAKANVTRILWKAIIEAPPNLGDLILASLSPPFDFGFIDDINGRTCLHEAATAGSLRLVDLCLTNCSQVDKADAYGRSALHYACMNGHADVCRRLIEVKIPPNTLDMDNYSSLVYATLKGNVDCVRILLDEGQTSVQPVVPLNDLVPLSIASQSGHVDVVLLLLQRGAKCLPNSNGQYPLHLAAREGHAEVCKLLVHRDGWDTPDKYHEWTPLFHAARYGHDQCIQVLLEAGCRVNVVDEFGHLAVHYAAWYGHHSCVSRLLEAAVNAPPSTSIVKPDERSPLSDIVKCQDGETDHIPSLSLPPPIMSHRVYGHSYLDKSYLVQVTIGHPSSQDKGVKTSVRLDRRLISPASSEEYLLATKPLKLVMTTSPDVNSAPYSISLPQRDEESVFIFQTPSLGKLSLEFSLYPNFGTKTIGRAIALPSLFTSIRSSHPFVLPILDHRLHVAGEVPFEVNIVTPFPGVTLEVGGDVETYWKSTATPIGRPNPTLRQERFCGSNQTSPSNRSNTSSVDHPSTISSLRGSYIYLVVQMTRDSHPVIYVDWLLPEPRFDLYVGDVTLAQFEALAHSEGRGLTPTVDTSIPGWNNSVSRSMVPLGQMLKILPTTVGVMLELVLPPHKTAGSEPPRHRTDLNQFVDSVLQTIYNTSANMGGPSARRKIVFTSFYPDICTALNWKQPNYPVFFSSQCGRKCEHPHSPTASDIDGEKDQRLHSLNSAVELAKLNHLLGVYLDADFLLKATSLIQDIQNAGLLVGVYGAPEKTAALVENTTVDALLRGGMVVYNNSTHEII